MVCVGKTKIKYLKNGNIRLINLGMYGQKEIGFLICPSCGSVRYPKASDSEIANFMEIKSAEEASHKLNIAVIQSPASVLITDASGKIEFVNPKFSELTGYEINESFPKWRKRAHSSFRSFLKSCSPSFLVKRDGNRSPGRIR
jgi:PAS domain-containing protein